MSSSRSTVWAISIAIVCVSIPAEARWGRCGLFGRACRGSIHRAPQVSQRSYDRRVAGHKAKRVDPDDFQDVTGFSQLAKKGGQIFEKLFIDNRLVYNPLRLDGRGQLSGFINGKTPIQLLQFYSQNQEDIIKRKGKHSQAAQQINGYFDAARKAFGGKYGAFGNGKFLINLNVNTGWNCDPNGACPLGDSPEGGANKNELQVALATLNFMLNDAQDGRNPFPIRVQEGAALANGGLVGVDLSVGQPPIFRKEVLDILQFADPTFFCTGRFRLNALLNTVYQSDNYYKFIDAPANKEDFARRYGIQAKKEESLEDKLLIMGRNEEDESGVTDGKRLLQASQTNIPVQLANGIREGACFGSYDIKNNQSSTAGPSSDIVSSGIGFTHDAEEWLCLGRNGAMRRFLFLADGTIVNGPIQQEAPGSVALNSRKLAPSVSAGVSCVTCHSSGFIAGGLRSNGPPAGKRYFDVKRELATNPQFQAEMAQSAPEFTQQMLSQPSPFITAEEYKRRAVNASLTYRDALASWGSLLYAKPKGGTPQDTVWAQQSGQPEDFPGQFQMAGLPVNTLQQWKAPLTQRDAERELGLAAGSLAGFFGSSSQVARQTETGEAKAQPTISRAQFERNACKFFAQAGGQPVGQFGIPGVLPGSRGHTN